MTSTAMTSTAELYFQQGLQYLQIDNYEAAIAAFDRMLSEQPDHHEAWNERGIALENLERCDEALASYTEAIRCHPNFHQAVYNQGNMYLRLEKWDAAIAAYDRALDIQPDFYAAAFNRALVMDTLHRYDEAIASYDIALAIAPHYVEAWYNRALMAERLERDDEAIASYDRALAHRPGYANAWFNRGHLLEKQQRFAEAMESYRQAVAVQPTLADAWNNLGTVLERLERSNDAVVAYERALAIAPDSALPWYNMGNALRTLGRNAEARDCYLRALEFQPDYAEAYCNLGVACEQLHHFDEALDAYDRALALRPDFPEVRKNLRNVYQHLVPRWHFVMLNDRGRNEVYDRAIRKVVRDDTLVLDIGTGAGLLAMMAARAGARHVYTCEMVKPIASMAAQIIAQNGLQDRITTIAKKSSQLKVGEDLPERAGLLVAEIFDVGLLGEEAIATIRHARTHLLTPDATLLPCRGEVFGQLLESRKLFHEDCVTDAADFDVSAFNAFATTPTYLQREIGNYAHRFLSDVFPLFQFDFRHDDFQAQEQQMEITATARGVCHAIGFWFRLWLDEELFIDTSPHAPTTHWAQAVQLLPTAPHLEPGDRFQFTAKHNCHMISFQLAEI